MTSPKQQLVNPKWPMQPTSMGYRRDGTIYVCRTTPNIAAQLRKLEFKIQETFIPAILDRVFSCTEKCRKIFALPAREGGLSIYDISETSDMEYQNSRKMTASLTNAIYEQATEYYDDMQQLHDIKTEISQGRVSFYKQKRKDGTAAARPCIRKGSELLAHFPATGKVWFHFQQTRIQ